MVGLRKSFEEGHQRKFLVVIDHTEECNRAVAYAAKRAERTGGILKMLCVISPAEFQHWLGVEQIMKAEAAEEAENLMAAQEKVARLIAQKVEIEQTVRNGQPADEILALIDEDEDIGILVLAAGSNKDGPGPLVSALVNRSASDFPVPVTIVPANLSDEDITGLA